MPTPSFIPRNNQKQSICADSPIKVKRNTFLSTPSLAFSAHKRQSTKIAPHKKALRFPLGGEKECTSPRPSHPPHQLSTMAHLHPLPHLYLPPLEISNDTMEMGGVTIENNDA